MAARYVVVAVGRDEDKRVDERAAGSGRLHDSAAGRTGHNIGLQAPVSI